jgi:CubicO group peptidase (beta-lactamase class C family)
MTAPSVQLDRRRLLQSLGAVAIGSALPAGALARGRQHRAAQAVMDRYVAEGKIAGAVAAFVAPGAFRPTYLTAGTQAFDSKAAVTPDSLFRIYSMTKPITGMAVMQAIAAGRLTLDTPIAEILPAYRAMTVLIDPAKGLDARPAKSPILLRHILTHSAGLSYHINGTGPLELAYRKAGLMPGAGRQGMQPGDGAQPDLAGFVEALAKLPLHSDPGSEWKYSVGLDLAGGLLQKLHGKPFGQVLQAGIFDPLGMADTGFIVPAASLPRLTTSYYKLGEKLMPIDTAQRSEWAGPPLIESGGGGLVSSTRDYARFAAMLLGEGRLEGARVMSGATARTAMSNLLPANVFFQGTQGFGAGGRVTISDQRNLPEGEPPRAYSWGGAAGTIFTIDRHRGYAMVMMVQFLPSELYPMAKEMRTAVNVDLA